ncbi:MAG: hypothetical protein AUH29_03595 [Candidatus Rokubacteria bacterium 13_1_40CM_69_27]|nr:MAG: hypothetical protein AUH29_03595 [Candidatus Rokubacteria bacterium 13_1_40CM_69_27]OLC39513.1 MAG: hypothetical protein AUH81_01435 [Candidatus Rokubacteria bacterium 13_1_40CM_4_69_5]
MKRLAAGAGVTGLGLMSFVALVLCRSTVLGLEGGVLLFLFGAVLFVLGGSGYAALPDDAVASFGAVQDEGPTASRS